MNKTALLAGACATLCVLTLDATIKNRKLRKLLKESDYKVRYNYEIIQWYKLRYRATTDEVNFAYKRLDQWDRKELKTMFDSNQEFLEIVGPEIHPHIE